MLRTLVALALLTAAPAAFAECTGRTALPKMEEKMAEAEYAFSQNDSGYRDLAVEALDMLPCLEHLFTPSKARRAHLLVGAVLATEDPARAKLAFMAAKRIEPESDWPEWIPGDTPAGRQLLTVKRVVGGTTEVPPPMSGHIRFDGEKTYMRPTGTPSIFQLVDSTGRAEKAGYVWPEDDLPVYAFDKKRGKKGWKFLRGLKKPK